MVPIPARFPDRRVIDRLGDINRFLDHDGRRWSLQRPEPGFLGLFFFLLAARVFHFAGLFLRSFRPFLGLPDVFGGGLRRGRHFLQSGTRGGRSGRIRHVPRTVHPFVDLGCICGLRGEPGKQKGNDIG